MPHVYDLQRNRRRTVNILLASLGLDDRAHGVKDFLRGLDELRLVGVARFDSVEHWFQKLGQARHCCEEWVTKAVGGRGGGKKKSGGVPWRGMEEKGGRRGRQGA